MKQVNVRFFGAFRSYIPTGESIVTLEHPMSTKEFKNLIQMHLEKQCGFTNTLLIEESAIANDQRVLTETDLIDGTSMICLLPPVCGG